MTQLQLFQARAARDVGLSQAEANAGDWFTRALQVIATEIRGEATGEDIRLAVLKFIEAPHHPNVWGALINRAIVRGLLVKTGKFANMKTKRSHARMTPVLKRKATS